MLYHHIMDLHMMDHVPEVPTLSLADMALNPINCIAHIVD